MPATTPDHGARAHAPFAPSSAGRWTVCAQSVLLAEQHPRPRTSTPDTRFGEICHECSETALVRQMSAAAIRDMVDALTLPDGFTPADALTVITAYVGYVETRTAEMHLLYDPSEVSVLVEKPVTLVKGECHGTPDCAILWPGGMEIIDLKSGAGHIVAAERNPQLLTYAAALAKTRKLTSGTLRLTIVQPRRTDGSPTVDVWTDDVATAVAWGKTVRKVISAARANPTQPPITGSHCHWCPAYERCPAQFAEVTQALTPIDAAPPDTPPSPDLVPPETLATIVAKAPDIMRWLKAVLAYAHENPPPGWKLVEGSSDRVWRSDAEVAAALAQAGLAPDTFMTTRRVGITEATRILKLLDRQDLHTALFVKPPGKPTLVPIDDPRPALDATATLTAIPAEA